MSQVFECNLNLQSDLSNLQCVKRQGELIYYSAREKLLEFPANFDVNLCIIYAYLMYGSFGFFLVSLLHFTVA